MANLSNINNKFIVASDGKVGIGTTVLNAISGTNPTLTLGGTGISGGLILQKAGTDTARLYENAGNMVHQGMTGIGHHFYVNAATQAMVIDSSGQVLIDIAGTSGGDLSGGGFAYRNNSGSYLQLSSGVHTDAAVAYFYRKDVGGTSVESFGNISNSGLGLVLNSASNSNQLVLSQGGNVGINETSPASIGTGYGALTVGGTSGGGINFKINGNASPPGQIWANNTDMVFKTNSSRPFTFYTDSTMAVRIASGGNVGIGTTVTNGKLHIADTSSSSTTQYFSAASNTATYSYIKHIDNTVNTSKLTLGTVYGYNVPVDAMTIFNGNVGIGTASPGAKLDISESNSGVLLSRVYNTSTASASGSALRIASSSTTHANSNTIQFSDASYYTATISGDRTQGIVFRTSATGNNPITIPERMRITPGGDVNIFNNSSYTRINVNNKKGSAGGTSGIQFGLDDGAFVTPDAARIEAKIITNPYAALDFKLYGVGGLSNIMTLEGNGNVLFGTTGLPNGTSIYGSAFHKSTVDRMILRMATSFTGAAGLIDFFNPNGQVGYIATNGTATQYVTSSDYRLKEDLQDFNGLDKVSKIPVYDFKWKTDESRSYGVMAHELQEVLPDAVSGDKDAEEMQGVDYSKIVPLLVKSIQELKAEIELLKSK